MRLQPWECRVLGWGIASGIGLMVACSWFTVNLTASLPRGLYRLHPVPLVLTVGDVVLFPVPDSLTAWVAYPLLKPIGAVAGDVVCVSDDRLVIAGEYIGPVLATDTDGHPLPHAWAGCQGVPEGHVFLASPVSRSLDSRYFGSVSVTDLRALATPVLTWR